MRLNRDALKITKAERLEMEKLLRATYLPRGLGRRIEVLFLLEEGHSLRGIREKVGMGLSNITKWRDRFQQKRISGLLDEHRAGRPRRLDEPQA